MKAGTIGPIIPTRGSAIERLTPGKSPLVIVDQLLVQASPASILCGAGALDVHLRIEPSELVTAVGAVVASIGERGVEGGAMPG